MFANSASPKASPSFFFFNDTATTEIYTLSLHDALPIYGLRTPLYIRDDDYRLSFRYGNFATLTNLRSEEHTSELQSRSDLVCRLLLEKKKEGIPGGGDHSAWGSVLARRCPPWMRALSLT